MFHNLATAQTATRAADIQGSKSNMQVSGFGCHNGCSYRPGQMRVITVGGGTKWLEKSPTDQQATRLPLSNSFWILLHSSSPQFIENMQCRRNKTPRDLSAIKFQRGFESQSRVHQSWSKRLCMMHPAAYAFIPAPIATRISSTTQTTILRHFSPAHGILARSEYPS